MPTFSCTRRKRDYCMERLMIPPLSEVKTQLGPSLAQVMIDKCPKSLRKQMSLTDPLMGPGETLWISPSDLLIGKAVLTPPFTTKYVKALSHEGILNMGERLEAQWLAALEEEKQRELENMEAFMMLLAERAKERAVEEALTACEQKFQKYVDSLSGEFEAVLLNELAELEKSLRAYYENLLDEQMREQGEAQDEYLANCIDNAVKATVEELTRKFMQDLKDQELELEAIFNARLAGQRDRHKHELQQQQEVFAIVMKQLKHNLQCNNIASLMYVMCTERRKCMQEQHLVVSSIQQNMHEMRVELDEKRKEAHLLHCQLQEKTRQLTIREECLTGVISQFQKFINYALRAVPTQAEFLLSVEKMMTLELAQALVRTKEQRKPRLAKLLMPWRTISTSTTSSTQTSTKPFHDCLNELDPPCKEAVDEELLAIIYKKRTYVREDFRNRIEQGDFNESSNKLWSKEIQDLVTLMQTVNEEGSEVIPSASVEKVSVTSPPERTDSVHFLLGYVDAHDPVGLLAINDSIEIRDSHGQVWSRPTMPDPTSRADSPIALLAAQDSVQLIKYKTPTLVASPTEGEREVRMTMAPSTTTFRIKKERARRVTVYRSPNDELVVTNVSDVTLQLNKHKISVDTNVQTRSLIVREPSPSEDTKTMRRSLISQHKDSLELTASRNTAHSSKLKKIIVPTEEVDPEYPVCQYAIQIPQTACDPSAHVNFKQVADVFREVYRPEKPWKIYAKPSKNYEKQPSILVPPPSPAGSIVKRPRNFLKQKSVAKVLGNVGVEQNRTTQDFTIHRIHSLMDVLKKDDSLIRLFTRCTQ